MQPIPQKTRNNVFKAIKAGYSYQRAGDKFDISPSTIYSWVRAKRLASGTTKTTTKGKKTIAKKHNRK